MNPFKIHVKPDRLPSPDDVQSIAMRAHDVVFTRLLRPGEKQADDYLRAPAFPLAFWLVDNWWRMRWESIPSHGVNSDWRLAHDLASIGGGYVWPRLTIWGEDARIGLASRSDPSGVTNPVRYLTDALLFVSAAAFEAEVDRFVANVLGQNPETSENCSALSAQWEALKEERSDQDVASWRRMEARLGFDPDEAPEEVIYALAKFAKQFGAASVEEAAMAEPGANSPKILQREIAAAQASRIICEFEDAINACNIRIRSSEPPWKSAERATAALRKVWGQDTPLRNHALADLFRTRAEVFRTSASPLKHDLSYGLRLHDEKQRVDRIAVRSGWSHDRRFELARALGDAVWNRHERLGPLAASKSARQKFQRAFAQSLLCPYENLISYIGTDRPTEGDLFAAARHFHVSERVVRTVLVNKNVIERQRLMHLNSDGESSGFDQLAEAA